MGPAFSKLMTRQNNTSSTPDTNIPQYTVEDMEFEATVISTDLQTDVLPKETDVLPKETDVLPKETDSKTDVLPTQDSNATEPELATEPEPVIESPLQTETQIEDPESEEPVEQIIEDKPGKKDKKEKRKKLRKNSL